MASTKKINKNDLLPWFLEDHKNLPEDYLIECEEFFKWLKENHKRNEARKH